MHFRKLAIFGFVLTLALVVAACNGDDDVDTADADDSSITDVIPGIGDDDDDDVATPEPDDAFTDDDDIVTDDDDPAFTDDRESATLTIEENALTLQHDDEMMNGTNGVGVGTDDDDAVVDDEDDAIVDDDDDAVLDDDDDAVMDDDDDAVVGDDDDTTVGVDDHDLVRFSTGQILLNITNNSDTEYGLLIERVDENGVGTDDDDAIVGDDDDAVLDDDDDAVLDDDDDAIVDDDDDAVLDDDDDTAVGNGLMTDEHEYDGTLAAGDTTEWELDLEPGTYVLYVTVDGERQPGMEVRFIVEDRNGLMDDGMVDDEDDGLLDDDDDDLLDDDDEEDDS